MSNQSNKTPNSKQSLNQEKLEYFYPDSRLYEDHCFLEIFGPIKKDFQTYSIRNLNRPLYEQSQQILEDYFSKEWPSKKKLDLITSQIKSMTQFNSIEIDGLLLVHGDGKKQFELSCLDSPVKYLITPPCLIVAECTIQPVNSFYKLFTLEKICCSILANPHNFFTPKEMNHLPIENFPIIPLLITNHSFTYSLSQYEIALINLQNLFKEENKTQSFVLAKQPKIIQVVGNTGFGDVISSKQLEHYIEFAGKFQCLHLYKKEMAMQNIFQQFNGIKQEIIQVKDQVDQVEKKMTKMQQDIGNMKGDIENMKEDIGNMKEDIGNVKGDIENMKEDIGNVKGDIGNMKGDIENMKGYIENMKGDIKAILDLLKNK